MGAAMLGGEGLFQTSVKGTGKVVIQAPGKTHRIDIQGHKLSVDGKFAVARTSDIDFSVQKASKSLIGSMTSGEGLLNTFQGTGSVYLAPVPNLYNSLVEKCSYVPQAATSPAKGCGFGMVALMSGAAVTLASLGAVAMHFL